MDHAVKINFENIKDDQIKHCIEVLGSIADEAKLNSVIGEIFTSFDKDNSGALDRKELKDFLTSFFQKFQIAIPLTDEFVDATFAKIDEDHSQSIEKGELSKYAHVFVAKTRPLFDEEIKKRGL